MPFATVGRKGLGKAVFTFTAASQDSGTILATIPVTEFSNGIGDLPPGANKVTIQLLPGDMTVGSITVYGTLDAATVVGNASNWEPLPAPATEAAYQWSNPLTSSPGQRLCAVDKAFSAYRAVSSDDYNGTTAQLVFLVVP